MYLVSNLDQLIHHETNDSEKVVSESNFLRNTWLWSENYKFVYLKVRGGRWTSSMSRTSGLRPMIVGRRSKGVWRGRYYSHCLIHDGIRYFRQCLSNGCAKENISPLRRQQRQTLSCAVRASRLPVSIGRFMFFSLWRYILHIW